MNFRIFVEGDQNVKQKWLLYVEKAYYSKPYRMNTSKYQHLLYELLNTFEHAANTYLEETTPWEVQDGITFLRYAYEHNTPYPDHSKGFKYTS
jgi:hypothetical protein